MTAVPRRPGAVVLLGDSILDNGAYTGGGPHVAAQLQAALPDGWRAVLAAVDGATTEDVPRQMRDVPEDAALLVLSAGGNDLLMHSGVLDQPATRSAEVLAKLAHLADAFEVDYRAMLRHVLAPGIPTALCTVYDGNLPAPMGRLAATAMAVFDHRILRVALEKGLPVIELRAVCTRPDDYANPSSRRPPAARRSRAPSPGWSRSTTSRREGRRCTRESRGRGAGG